MAKVVPIRWQGASRMKSLSDLVRKQSLTWLQDWAAAPGEAKCVVECFPLDRQTVARTGCGWLSMAGAQGMLWWRTSPGTLEQIGRCLVGARETDGLGLAAGIGRRALRDLSMHWTGAGRTIDLDSELRPDADTLDARHGVAGFSWALGGVRAELYFDSALCAALAPSTTAPAELTSRSEAIGPARLTLHAVLDLGIASLEDTLVLRPGEVIRTRIALNQPVRVQTESGDTVFAGALVASEKHRALRFISHG